MRPSRPELLRMLADALEVEARGLVALEADGPDLRALRLYAG